MEAKWRVALATLTVALALALPSSAAALAFRQPDSGGTVVVGAGETIDDDLYVSGSSVDIRGTVLGSVFAAGNNVSVAGTVTGDVWAAGNTVRVDAETSGTVHAAGNDVTVRGRTGRDVTAAGATVRLEPDLAVGRDAALAGATILASADIARTLYVSGSDVTVSGHVGGDINGDVEKLTIANGARVEGDVRYRSGNEARVEPGATVAGRVQRSARPAARVASPAERALLGFLGWIRRLIGLVLFGLLVVLLFPLFTRRATGRIAGSPLPSLGIGFAALFLTPLAVAVTFLIGLLVGGWWIALVLLALYAIAVAVATIVSAVFLGGVILDRLAHRPVQHVYALLLGLLILTVLEAIPVLGILVRMAEVVFGLGAIALAIAAPTPPPALTAEAPPPAPMRPMSGV